MDGDEPRAPRSTRWLALALGGAIVAGAPLASAQRVSPGQPLTVVVGASPGNATTEGLDAARSHLSTSPLPTHGLRIVWTRRVAPVHEPPVVLADGTVVVVSEDGEALLVNHDGTDQARVSLGPGPVSAPSILADGTTLVVNGAGDAVGVRRGAIVYRTHVVDSDGALDDGERVVVRRSPIARGYAHASRPQRGPARETPAGFHARTLPLEDGGALVALGRELACLDAKGALRSRATAPAAVASPLIATARGVAYVAENGDAYVWDRNAAEAAVFARGSFGGSVDGAVAADGTTRLLAVVEGSRLVSLDLTTEETSTRARAGSGAFTGAFALAGDRGALVEEVTIVGTRVLAIEREGQTSPFGTLLTSQGAQPAPDAGPAGAFSAPTHTALFADPSGAVAYATIDGRVGVAAPSWKVELGSLPCGIPPAASSPSNFRRSERPSAGFAGLVPAGPGAFVVACENGRVSEIEGESNL